MNKAIWKFPVDGNSASIEMPRGSEVLCAKVQHERIYIWAICDPKEDLEGRSFEIIPTGAPLYQEETLKYIDTVMQAGGSLVFHIFEQL